MTRTARPPSMLTGAQAAGSPPPVLAALVTLFVLSMFVPQAVYLPVGPLQITPSRVLAIVMFPLVLTAGRIRWTWPDLVVGASLAATLVSFTLRGGVAAAVESVGRQFLDVGMAYLVGRCVASEPGWFPRLARLVVGILAVLSVFVVLESVARFNIHLAVWGAVTNVGTVFSEERLGFARARGWTTHPIMLGLAYAAFLPLALHAALSRDRLVGRFAALKAVALAAGAFFSMSSGAWIAAVAVVVLFAWDRAVRLRPAYRWGIFFVGAPLAYLVLEVLSSRPLLRILMMRLHIAHPDAWAYRWRLNQRVLEQMPDHWAMGWGLELPEAFTGVIGWSIDNNYLLLLLQTGIVGLSVWIAAMLAVIGSCAGRVWFAGDDNTARVARAPRFAVLALAIAQFSVAMFSTAAVATWLMMGIAVGLGQVAVRQSCVVTPAGRRRPPGPVPRPRRVAAVQGVGPPRSARRAGPHVSVTVP